MPHSADIFVRHQHYLEQFANGEVKKFAPHLRNIVAGLRLELLKTENVNSEVRRLVKIEYVDAIVARELKAYTDALQEQLKAFGHSEAAFTVETMAHEVALSLKLPSEAQTWAAVKARPFNSKLLKEALADFTKAQARAVRNAVSVGFYEGKTTQAIVRDIVGTRSQQYKNGVLDITRREAEGLVRTALNHTASVAKNLTLVQNVDLLPYYEWLSTLDGRTSNVCKSLDGKVFRTGKGRLPPAHRNCRSTISPLLKSEVDPNTLKKRPIGGTRSSVNGQVDADLNYNDRLKKQSVQFQNDVLGPTRAELFRSGGLSLDKFVNNIDQTLTLEQLKLTYPTAWAKADL